MVEGSQEGVPAGVYDVPANKSTASKAIVPGSPSTVAYSGPMTTENIIDFDSLVRRDAPDGWELTEDGTFKSQDGEWEISPIENGRYTISQNGELLEGDYRDAATAITRATAVDAENTADEDTKQRVATLRSEGASQKRIDRALFNEPDDEDEAEDAEPESTDIDPNLEKLLKYEFDIAEEDRAMRENLINNPVIWREGQNDRINELINERERFYSGLTTEEQIALRESQLKRLKDWEEHLAANNFYDPTVARNIRQVEGMISGFRGDDRARLVFPGLIDPEDSDEERSLQLAIRSAGTPAGTKAVTTFNPSAPGASPRREVWTKQEDGTWKNDETGFVRDELPKPWTIQDGFGRGGYGPVKYLQFPDDDGKESDKEKPKAKLPAKSAEEIRADLNELNDRFESLEVELRALAESGEDPEVASDKLDELLAVTEEIEKLEAEYNQARLLETPRELARQEEPDTVESIRRRIKRLEGQAERRAERGEDTDDIDKEIEDLEKQAQALEDAGEKEDGTGEGKPEPAAGGDGEEPPSDGGGAGTLPGDMGEEDAPSSDLERRGDTLRDVYGNVIARKVDDVANAEEIREGGAKVVDLFEVDPAQAETFRNSLIEAAKSNPYGGSVTIHDLEYYQQPGVRMFLTQDGKGGIVLNDDEIVSGFMADDAVDRGRGAVQSMISKMVELGGRRLDAYDTILPELYAEAGFKPVARIKWDDEFAPEGWDYELYGKWNDGRPDIVFMAYDPERVGSEYDKSEGEYVDDYDLGLTAQQAALEPITDEQVLNDLTDRQRAALARREAAQAANDALAGEDGLLVGAVPLDARETISHQALLLAPIGQVVEATSRNGRKRRFIKVGRDVWKRTDKQDDKKRYRSHELRGGTAEFVQRTDADVPSADEVRGPVDRYRPKPFSFPRNATDEELARLREIYQNQAETDENAGGALRAEETVRLIDLVLARRQGQPIARRRSATDRRIEDQRAGRPTEAVNTPARRTGRGVAPLLENNEEVEGQNSDPYEPNNDMPEGTTDDPEQLSQMYDTIALKQAYLDAIANGEDTVRFEFPGANGEPNIQANIPIEAVRDTLQRLGVDTNELVNPELTRESNDIEGTPIPDYEAGTDPNRSAEMSRLYQTLQELNVALVQAENGNLTPRQLRKINRQRKSIIRRIKRLEDKGFRNTSVIPQIDLSNFSWDSNEGDVYNPNLVMKALQDKYPEATVLPNGDLFVASNEWTDPRGNRRRYDVIITQTDDDMFYPYIRETRYAEQDPAKRYRSLRFGVMRQSARAVNNQAVEAINRINNGGEGWNVVSWFNQTTRRKEEGNPARIDAIDENGEPVHEKYRVFTQEAVTKILNAVDNNEITEEMINTLYNYINTFGNGDEVAATLYQSFGLDINTMNKFIDAVNKNIDERQALRRFSSWVSNTGIPLVEGDIVEYVGNNRQQGHERLKGRRGIIEIRQLEYSPGNDYTYTDYVRVRWIDEDGNTLPGENFDAIPAKNLKIQRTSGGTDGTERIGDNAMSVPLPRLTTRAINRYAGRGQLRNVQPYIAEFDRETMAGPTVTIDGKSYPVQSSRTSIISENMEKIGATPSDLRVGDFIRTLEDGPNGPHIRLNEVVGIDELEDGGRIIHTVMPINISSGRVASTEYPAGVSLQLDVYRERVPETEDVDPTAPGLSNGQQARLAELMREVDTSRLDPDTLTRINEIVSSPDPAQLPYNQLEFNDIFLEALEAETDVANLRGQVSPEEAARLIENMVRRAQPNPNAAMELENVRRAGLQRAGELNNLPAESFTPNSPELRPASGMSDVSVNMGPVVDDNGVILSPDWVDQAEDGAILKMEDRLGENNLLIKKNGFWVKAKYGIDRAPLQEGQSAWDDEDIKNFIGVSISGDRQTFSIPITEEEIQKYKDYAAGTIDPKSYSTEEIKEALVNRDIVALDAMFVGGLFENGEKKYGDYRLRYSNSSWDSNEVYTQYSDQMYVVSAAIVDDNNAEVGTLIRYVSLNREGELRVVHSLMRIYNQTKKNSGFSKEYSAASEELYKDLGVEDIYVFTAWDGSYVWAKAGYGWNFDDYDKSQALGGVPDRLEEAAAELEAQGNTVDAAKLRDILERFELDTDDPNFPTPYEIASLQSSDESVENWGRKLMTDSRWYGIKRLGDYGKTGEQIAAEKNSTEAAAPEAGEEVRDVFTPPDPRDFVSGPSDEFEGWDNLDSDALQQARTDAIRAEALRSLDSRVLTPEERELSLTQLNVLFPENPPPATGRRFQRGAFTVYMEEEDQVDSPEVAMAMRQIDEVVSRIPVREDSTPYVINLVNGTSQTMAGAGGVFQPGLNRIEYYLPPILSNWDKQPANLRNFFTPDVNELLDQNNPEETREKFLAHIVAHEYGHLVDSNFSTPERNLNKLFRDEIDKAGIADMLGGYANSYADVEEPGIGNKRNSEYFAEAFAQMISEDLGNASPSEVGALMRQFLKDNGVIQ
jgi:hypothetical protein